jgi:5-(carboxyamino)imidazole ribonucleotide mutase
MKAPQVVIILGSESDEKIFGESKMLEVLDMTGISYEVSVISADRREEELRKYCLKMLESDVKVFIGAAGALPALPGNIAAIIKFQRPVLCVPLEKDVAKAMTLKPAGAPVPVAGIGKAGLYNAAMIACQIIAIDYFEVYERFKKTLEIIKERKPAKIGIIRSKETEVK